MNIGLCLTNIFYMKVFWNNKNKIIYYDYQLMKSIHFRSNIKYIFIKFLALVRVRSNVIVVIMSYGNNQDDSLIFNDKSLKNKLSNNNKYRYQYLSNKMNREILININLNYRDNLPKRNIKIAYYLHNINEPLYRIYDFK